MVHIYREFLNRCAHAHSPPLCVFRITWWRMRVRVDVRIRRTVHPYIYRKTFPVQTTRLARSHSPINERFQDFKQDSRFHVEISGLKSPLHACAIENRRCPVYKGQLAVLELGASAIFQNNAHAQHNKPAHLGISMVISRISRKISGFQRRFHGFRERFQGFHEVFLYFNEDFRISGKITRDFRSVRNCGKWRTPRLHSHTNSACAHPKRKCPRTKSRKCPSDKNRIP